MNIGEILVLIVVCIAFVAAVVGIAVGKIRHKGGCGGNCACCNGCARAHSPADKTDRRQNRQ